MYITERLMKETARDYALRTIKENIIMLELTPGSMVSENELAAEMGLSRTPIREALMDLSKTQIVEIYPQKGSRVSLVNYELVEEARFMRLVLETAIVELACETATPVDIQNLEENIHLQEFYLQSHTNKKIMQLDDEFHKELFKICKKLQTYALMDSMTAHFDRVRNMSLYATKDIKIVADHAAIVESIKRHDAKLSKQFIAHHLSRYKIDEEAIRAKYPHYFI